MSKNPYFSDRIFITLSLNQIDYQSCKGGKIWPTLTFEPRDFTFETARLGLWNYYFEPVSIRRPKTVTPMLVTDVDDKDTLAIHSTVTHCRTISPSHFLKKIWNQKSKMKIVLVESCALQVSFKQQNNTFKTL